MQQIGIVTTNPDLTLKKRERHKRKHSDRLLFTVAGEIGKGRSVAELAMGNDVDARSPWQWKR